MTIHRTSVAVLAAAVLAVSMTRLWAGVTDLPLSLDPLAGGGKSGTDSIPYFDASKAAGGDSDRYGFLGLLDHRSIYGKDWFPEPLLADEADVDNEVAISYNHFEGHDAQSDEGHVEIEKSFGLLTLEIAGGYSSERALDEKTQEGFTNIELGARYPVAQYVSPNGFVDTTLVLALEIAPPTHTRVSKDTEIVPKIFSLTRLGEHLSVRMGLGNSIRVGIEDRGLSSLEYDLVVGYELEHDVLPIPYATSTVPILELNGENFLNQEIAGHNELTGTIGFRVNFESVSGIQPKLGLGYIVPIDHGARQEFKWGMVASLIFEY